LKGLSRLTERALVDHILERLPDLEIHTVGPKADSARR
jgi:hypothetical protein